MTTQEIKNIKDTLELMRNRIQGTTSTNDANDAGIIHMNVQSLSIITSLYEKLHYIENDIESKKATTKGE